MKRVLSFDFGASSGRAMLAELKDGKIDMREIHRFSNDTVIVNGTMYWDILRLFFEIKTGITKAVNEGGFDAIGIDTWGVDFGLIDKYGKLIGNPVHYRDTRTEGIAEEIADTVSKSELYKRTGTQHMRFNTLFQLMYLKNHEPEQLENAEKMLLIPDLFAYMLTGEIKAEASIVSTTNMFDPYKKDWDFELIKKLGLKESLFPQVIPAGETYGMLSDEICEELGCNKVPVIAVNEHDTASAVVATPSLTDDFVYISCGTWSLFGIESKDPIITDEAEKLNFTNEGGYKGTVRFLKNIMGLWLIQQSRQEWKRQGLDVSFDEMENAAKQAEPFKCFVDPDAKDFVAPGNMPKRVQEFCKRTGQYVPQNMGEILRCIYQSLAFKYRYATEMLEKLIGHKLPIIHMIGGGIKDQLLCRMAADYCQRTVMAGPVEATVTGNAAVQFMAFGEFKDLNPARQVIKDSFPIKTYEPDTSLNLDPHFEEFKKYINID